MKSSRTNGNGHCRPRVVDPRHAFFGETMADLSTAKVAILGCGSLGSFAAWNLASCGVGRMCLADFDHLSSDNIRRHVCTASEVGQAKTASLARDLSSRFPQLDVTTHDGCFLSDPDGLHNLLAECEIALVAIDCEGPKYLINDILWYLQRPAVFAGVYGGGWGAEFVLVDPRGGTACYGCAANWLGRVGISAEQSNWPPYAIASVGRTPTNANQTKDSNSWMQASLTSIMPAAALAADLVAAVLDAHRGHGRRLTEFRQHDASAWRLAIRRVPAWRLGPWGLESIPIHGQTACPQKCAIPNKVAA